MALDVGPAVSFAFKKLFYQGGMERPPVWQKSARQLERTL